MKKYYLQQGCIEGLPVQAGDYKVQFDPVQFFAGQWWGVFATEDEKVSAALDSIAGTFGVSEITEADFLIWIKKKGTRQTNTWKVTEAVSGEVPTPQPPAEKSADSVTDQATDQAEPVQEHSMDDLLETKQRDDATPEQNYVTSQAALADTLGISLPKLRDLAKQEGNPGKSTQGYNIPEWESFLNKNG